MTQINFNKFDGLDSGVELIGLDDTAPAFKFTRGKFDGVVFIFTDFFFAFIDDETGEEIPDEDLPKDGNLKFDTFSLKVNYTYHVIKNPEKADVDKPDFTQQLSEIVQQLCSSGVIGGEDGTA